MKIMELGSECRLLSPTPRLTCLILFPVVFSDFAEILCKKSPYKQGRVKRRIKVFGLWIIIQEDLKVEERVGTASSMEDKAVGMSWERSKLSLGRQQVTYM